MSERPPAGRVSRRKALKALAGSAGMAISLPVLSQPAGALCPVAPLRAATESGAALPRFFTTSQLQTVAALCETIIPTDQHSPGAKAAGVPQFVDEIVAVANPETQSLWTTGLSLLDQTARATCGLSFGACSADQQIALLEKISANEHHPATLAECFFVAAKRATLEGYYTSPVGIHQDLEYQGNTALVDFPGCPAAERQE